MAATIKLDDETRGILASMSIDGTVAKLPPGQLARPVYEKVNKALAALGGKWNRSKGGHVFSADPTPLLRNGVEGGAVENLKQKFQFFETPEPLASRMADLADIFPGHRVLEPSAGYGRLARAARALQGAVVAFDLNPECVAKLQADGFSAHELDFYATPAPQPPIYHAAIMNPPFTRGQATLHIRHAWDWLKPLGRLVAIVDGGAMFRQQTRDVEFRAWLDDIGAEREELPRGTFPDTDVSSWLIWAYKPEAG